MYETTLLNSTAVCGIKTFYNNYNHSMFNFHLKVLLAFYKVFGLDSRKWSLKKIPQERDKDVHFYCFYLT